MIHNPTGDQSSSTLQHPARRRQFRYVHERSRGSSTDAGSLRREPENGGRRSEWRSRIRIPQSLRHRKTGCFLCWKYLTALRDGALDIQRSETSGSRHWLQLAVPIGTRIAQLQKPRRWLKPGARQTEIRRFALHSAMLTSRQLRPWAANSSFSDDCDKAIPLWFEPTVSS